MRSQTKKLQALQIAHDKAKNSNLSVHEHIYVILFLLAEYRDNVLLIHGLSVQFTLCKCTHVKVNLNTI